MKVAFAGKGGAGKTMIAGTIARLLARRGRRVLAIDDDPSPNLALTLGIAPEAQASLDLRILRALLRGSAAF